MVGAVVAALDQLSKVTPYGADDELVFAWAGAAFSTETRPALVE
jgi:hypothetical protein